MYFTMDEYTTADYIRHNGGISGRKREKKK